MSPYENEQQRLYGQQINPMGAVMGATGPVGTAPGANGPAHYGQQNMLNPWANECAPKMRKEGTVTMEMHEMEKLLEAMTVAIDILSNKLAPVVISAPEQPPVLRGNGPTGSDLAIELGRRNACLRDHLTRLELLHQGIDL